MFSNFQIITGDSWCSGIVRLFFDADGNLPYGPVAFFVSFIVIVGWTLLQVVVALLLDNFNTATQKEKNEAAALLAEEQGFEYEMRSLDPVLASLSHFETDHDLKDRICTLFEVGLESRHSSPFFALNAFCLLLHCGLMSTIFGR